MAQKLKVNDQLFVVDGSPMGGDEVTLEGITFDRANRTLGVGNLSVTSFLAAYGITSASTAALRTAAIQAAFDTARTNPNGAALHFPAGEYEIILDTLNITSSGGYPLRIFGDGYQSHIKFTGSGNDGITCNSSNVTIEGLRFSGDCCHAVKFYPDGGDPNLHDCSVVNCFFENVATVNAGGLNAPIEFESVDRFRVLDVTISGSGIAGTPATIDLSDSLAPRTYAIGALVFYDGAKGYRNIGAVTTVVGVPVPVLATSVLGNSTSAIGAVNVVKDFASNTPIAGLTCNNTAAIAQTNPNGYEILAGGDYEDPQIDGINITMAHTVIGIALFNPRGGKISRFEIDGGGFANGAWSESGYPIACYRQFGASHTDTRQLSIVHGRVHNSAGAGVYVQGIDHSSVMNVIAEDCAQKLDNVSLESAGIVMTSTNHGTIIGCTVKDSGHDGISVASGTDCSVSGCIVSDATGAGIRVRGTADRTGASGNTVTGCGSHGLYADSSVTGLVFSSNTVDNCAGAGLLASDANNSVAATNTISDCASHGILWLDGARNIIAHNLLEANTLDLQYSGDMGEISGNSCNPAGATALYVTGDNNTIVNNRLHSGLLTVAGTGNIRGGNRVANELDVDVIARDTYDNGRVTGGSVTLDCAASLNHVVMLGSASTAISFSNLKDGMLITVQLVQDASGSRTATWPTYVRFNSALTLSSVMLERDLLSFKVLGTGSNATLLETSRSLGIAISWVDVWDADVGVVTALADVVSWTGMINSDVLTPPANKPTLDTGGINGANAIKFVRTSSQWLTNTTTAALYQAANGNDPNITVVCQMRAASAPNPATVWFWGGNTGATANRCDFSIVSDVAVQVNARGNGGVGGFTSYSVASVTAAAHVYAMRLESVPSQALFVDTIQNVTTGSIDADSRAAIRFDVGAYSDGTAGFFFDGWIRRIGIIAGVPTPAELAAIQLAWSTT